MATGSFHNSVSIHPLAHPQIEHACLPTRSAAAALLEPSAAPLLLMLHRLEPPAKQVRPPAGRVPHPEASHLRWHWQQHNPRHRPQYLQRKRVCISGHCGCTPCDVCINRRYGAIRLTPLGNCWCGREVHSLQEDRCRGQMPPRVPGWHYTSRRQGGTGDMFWSCVCCVAVTPCCTAPLNHAASPEWTAV